MRSGLSPFGTELLNDSTLSWSTLKLCHGEFSIDLSPFMISGAEGVSSSPFFPGQQVPGTGNAVQPGNEPLLYEFVSVFLAPLD